MALELSIKNNEDMVLSFQDCKKLLEANTSCQTEALRFTLQFLVNTERQILIELNFRLNLPTSLDFLLQYAFSTLGEHEAKICCVDALPWLYYSAINYS